MPVTHTNRKGDIYYLHKGTTKTGKPRYHFSRKKTGELADVVPEGYEVYEAPVVAQVFLRKIAPRAVSDEELLLVERAVRQLAGIEYPIIDLDGDSIVVYTPAQDRQDLEQLVAELSPWSPLGTARKVAELQRRGQYMPMMRFTLVDTDQRRFRAERWCFRGAIDGWIPLSGGRDELTALVERYCPHLGQESFFDLF